MNSKALSEALKTIALARKKALVIGDVGLDCYVTGVVDRISPEAPVPVLNRTGFEKEERLGMAANVAANLASMGSIVSVASIVGSDHAGIMIMNGLKKVWGVCTDAVVVDHKRTTSEKTRFIVGNHQLLRVDSESVDKSIHSEVLRTKVVAAIHNADVVIVEDYCKGVMQNDLMSVIFRVAHECRKPVLVDPNVNASLKKYIGCTAITPNAKEAEAFCGIKPDASDPTSVRTVLKKITDALTDPRDERPPPVVVLTLGAGGMAAMIAGEVEILPTAAKQVFDVSGAGDTAIAVLALAMATGTHLRQAIELANVAAGVVVGKPGTAIVSLPEIEDALWASRSLR